MGGAEAVEPRHQPFGREGGIEADRDSAALLVGAQQVGGVGQLVETVPHGRQGGLAGLGQPERAGQAPEQRDAHLFLKRLDLVADRRRGDMQLLGGLGEAQMPRRGLEGAQRIERGQVAGHIGLYLRNSKTSTDERSFVPGGISSQISLQGNKLSIIGD